MDLHHLCNMIHAFGFQEIDVPERKALVIYMSPPLLKPVQKVQNRLVREMEKKFPGKHVVFVAQVKATCCKILILFIMISL